MPNPYAEELKRRKQQKQPVQQAGQFSSNNPYAAELQNRNPVAPVAPEGSDEIVKRGGILPLGRTAALARL